MPTETFFSTKTSNALGSVSTTIAPDPAVSESYTVTLTGNVSVTNPATGQLGQMLLLQFTQDSTGSRTLTWGTKYLTAWQPAAAAGAISTVAFWFDGTNWQQAAGQVPVDHLGNVTLPTPTAPAAVSTGTGTAAGSGLSVTGAIGGASSNASGTGGVGGGYSVTGGAGGAATGTTAPTGGAGGAFTVAAGAGGAQSAASSGASTGGAGGAVSITAGAGGAPTAGNTNVGGVGGASSLVAGAGGNAATTGGVGGAANITAGAAGTGGNVAGGNVVITAGAATGTGNVGLISLASAIASGLPTGLPTTGTLGTNVTSVTPATGSNDTRGRLTIVSNGSAIAAGTSIATITFFNAKRYTGAPGALAAPVVILTNSSGGANGASAYAGGYSTSAAGQTSFVLVNMLATVAGAFTGTVDYWVIG
jgi:hypothetical protein